MALPVTNLDDRTFEEFRKQALIQFPRYDRLWNDYNVSDPGITFAELFAWLAEMQVYYLNRMPEEREEKFLRLLGFSRRGPFPASAPVSFTCREEPVIIPAGTQVVAIDNASQKRIVFRTDETIEALPVSLQSILTFDRTGYHETVGANGTLGKYYFAFGEEEQASNAFYISLKMQPEVVRGRMLSIWIQLYEDDLPPRGRHGDEQLRLEHDIPLCTTNCHDLGFLPDAEVYWEYWNGTDWVSTTGEMNTPILRTDGTCNMYFSGMVSLQIPPEIALKKISTMRDAMYLVRCRLVRGGHEVVPRIENIFLNTVLTLQAERFTDEIPVRVSHEYALILDSNRITAAMTMSVGMPDQVFTLKHGNIVQGSLSLVVNEGKEEYEWQEIPDFDASGPDDRHFCIDRVKGEFRFGNGIKGAIPPEGYENVKVAAYFSTYGSKGNVARGKISFAMDNELQLKGVAATNLLPAKGGKDIETLEDTRRRAMLDLRTPYQAVTDTDIEEIVKSTPGLRIARVKSLSLQSASGDEISAETNTVTVVVIPYSFNDKPLPGDNFLTMICRHLDCHRLITTNIEIVKPTYATISVEATVKPKLHVSRDELLLAIVDALNTFLHPLSGGTKGEGWEFGRSVYESEIIECIEHIEGVDRVSHVQLSVTDGGKRDGVNVRLDNPTVVVSHGIHRIHIADPGDRCFDKDSCCG